MYDIPNVVAESPASEPEVQVIYSSVGLIDIIQVITSEEELKTVMDDLLVQIQSQDWNQRMRSLQRLSALVEERHALDFGGFKGYLENMMPHILNQVRCSSCIRLTFVSYSLKSGDLFSAKRHARH